MLTTFFKLFILKIKNAFLKVFILPRFLVIKNVGPKRLHLLLVER